MGQIYFILFFLHFFLAVTYTLDMMKEDEGTDRLQKYAVKFVIVVMIPVFGFVLMWYTEYYEKKKSDKSPDVYIVKPENEQELRLLKPIDVSDEVNKVPMIEALSLGDYEYRRKMVVDTLKEDDTLEYLNVLKEALVNEDSETSHYASAIIMDVQGKLSESLFKREAEFHNNPENIENALKYEDELYKVIKSGIYDKRSLSKYYVRYKILSDVLLKEDEPKECCYHNRIDIDFATEDIVHAQQMCEIYKEKFPSSEEMVVDNIKLCIKMENRERLNSFLNEVKEMPVLLTSYSLQYIRFLESKQI